MQYNELHATAAQTNIRGI